MWFSDVKPPLLSCSASEIWFMHKSCKEGNMNYPISRAFRWKTTQMHMIQECLWHGETWVGIKMSLSGVYRIKNSLASSDICLACGQPSSVVLTGALPGLMGPGLPETVFIWQIMCFDARLMTVTMRNVLVAKALAKYNLLLVDFIELTRWLDVTLLL